MRGFKTGGRTSGTPNKITQAIKDKIADTVKDYYLSDTFASDIEALNSKERIEYMRKITDYILAKPKPIELETDQNEGVKSFVITSGQDSIYIQKLRSIIIENGLEVPEDTIYFP